GGISSAFDLFAPSMFKQLVSKYKLPNGKTTNRLPQKVYNLDDPEELESFLQEEYREITIPNTDKKMTYNPYFKTGVGVSKHDTALMIALGAYAFALQKLDEKKEIKPLPY